MLGGYVADHGGGEVFFEPLDVVLSGVDLVQPDLLFVGDQDRKGLTGANLHGAPALAVEILSDAHRARRLKRILYGRAGVKEYWLVDPNGDWVEVYSLEGASYGRHRGSSPKTRS